MKRGSTILTIEKVVRQMHSVANCFQKRSRSDKKFECPFGKKWIKIKTYRLGTSLSKIESAITTSSETWWLTVTCTERGTENKIILCSGAVRYKCKENLRGLRWGISKNARLRLLLLIRLAKTIIVLTTKDWAWWCLIWCWVRCSKCKWLKINFIWASDWSANERQ